MISTIIEDKKDIKKIIVPEIQMAYDTTFNCEKILPYEKYGKYTWVKFTWLAVYCDGEIAHRFPANKCIIDYV